MSRTSQKQPAVAQLTPRQIAKLDREADAFLLVADADALQRRVADAAARGIVTTPERLLKNDRLRQDHSRGVALAPRDSRGQVKKADAAAHADPIVKVDEAELAECFRETRANKTWGDAGWADQSGLGIDPADHLEALEEYELAGGDAAVAAQAKAEKEEEDRLKREAIRLLHPRDQERVRLFLTGVQVSEIAEHEECTVQCIYEALARSEQRIAALLEYRRQCKIWAATGERGERPELPGIDDGASAEQISLFCDDLGVQP